MPTVLRHPLTAVAGAVGLTVPWVALSIAGATRDLSTGTAVLVSGVTIVGAAFLLAWGAETAEKDVPRAFALAVLAVLAVAPEYAVDAFYAWQAGLDPGRSEAANLAIANMTGANRILIGIGWSAIALYTIFRAMWGGDSARDAVDSDGGVLSAGVRLDRSVATEITFLLAATLYAFFVPFMGGIDALDFAVLVGLYFGYIAIVVRGRTEETDHVGVPAYLQKLPRKRRIPVVLVLFAYSGLLIFTAVEPFAHGLERLGVRYGLPKFFMIQWIAPLASESPELIVVTYLVNKARETAAFHALISSKLNQWTLLVGTLVLVYSIAKGSYGVLPFDTKQAGEIWLTAAQSFFAIAALVDFRLDVGESLALLLLFLAQVGAEYLIVRGVLPIESFTVLLGFSAVYLVLGGGLFLKRREHVHEVLMITIATVRGERAGAVSAD